MLLVTNKPAKDPFFLENLNVGLNISAILDTKTASQKSSHRTGLSE